MDLFARKPTPKRLLKLLPAALGARDFATLRDLTGASSDKLAANASIALARSVDLDLDHATRSTASHWLLNRRAELPLVD